ncbi:protein involved in D-alanine esterification of lipoteichoic acid and wall teichoic acid (D-alanine transfer protein) [Streptococcus pneumoniae]|nr:protein involved in D-alanine esterification of lipoteichoic acid and wall teichoic acid (D-alanine transfer protein) [Streptococcus pneumoniae]CIS32106.1 protein involved in D-alanine esterification of lipoteichoic acid and wall teichoic acid (D-alanine transfer protein) [Streptococcus pneumoniae]CIW37335.1 protein involved in D-alanine esterification of lipoteichoic acid and wall teichoic acid (D-alanine transfer protein) [Streptococcus pneumoniae]CON68393.1 protein involved in D-alanine es
MTSFLKHQSGDQASQYAATRLLQQFPNVAMKDTIHLGWLGWLAFDKAVDPFLSNPTPAPTYHLNERFFSKDWATYDGDVKEFQ